MDIINLSITLLVSGLFSIVISVVTNYLIKNSEEVQTRQMYSRLGVATIEYLLEEIRNGIDLMKDALEAAKNDTIQSPPRRSLPNLSWEGKSTIPDEVLLRIIEPSKDQKPSDPNFPPSLCRSHCKNYFNFICNNYSYNIAACVELAKQGKDWRTPLIEMLETGKHPFILRAQQVKQMLEQAQELLDDNSKAKFPR